MQKICHLRLKLQSPVSNKSASNGCCLWEFPQILLCERWKFFKTISCCHHVLLDRITGVQANAQRSRLFTVPRCRSCKFCAHQPCVTCSNLMIFKLSYQLPTTLYTTVDGRSPAPPGMYKTFYIVGKTTNLNWCRISEPSTVSLWYRISTQTPAQTSSRGLYDSLVTYSRW